MPYRLVIRDVAAAEAIEARNWYEASRKGLGARFNEAILAGLDDVAVKPLQYPMRNGKFRYAPVFAFPYAIIYRVEGRAVVIVSVFHLKRKPRTRFKR
jgi:plasmid stabilization system protein ParE